MPKPFGPHVDYSAGLDMVQCVSWTRSSSRSPWLTVDLTVLGLLD